MGASRTIAELLAGNRELAPKTWDTKGRQDSEKACFASG